MGRITLPLYTPLYQPTGEEVAVIETTKGTVRVKLDAAGAPVTVGNFIELSARGFYNELKFHACKPGSVVLGGLSDHTYARSGTGGGGGSWCHPGNTSRYGRCALCDH